MFHIEVTNSVLYIKATFAKFWTQFNVTGNLRILELFLKCIFSPSIRLHGSCQAKSMRWPKTYPKTSRIAIQKSQVILIHVSDDIVRVSLNRTNGKDSRVRLRTNFLSITCCAIKRKENMNFATNCQVARLVGLSYAIRLVLEFESGRFFFLFLSFFP